MSEQKILHLSMGRIFCPTINDPPLDMPRKGFCGTCEYLVVFKLKFVPCATRATVRS